MSGKIKDSQLSKSDKELKKMEEKRKKQMSEYIGKNINKYRTSMKLTREQLAEKSHITASHLYQLEIGNSVPSIITIIDICNALNITIAQVTDNLLYENVNKFTELISDNFSRLSEKDKKTIIQLIKYMEDNN
ncbi:MAG: helix-turn-helix transcriptional regulator [Clostridiales bacterium]|nr:helix-turn-helix transcriptional regulator [Clostridiales bacterium]